MARLGAEGLVIVLGVLVALAVDRWATGLDERTLEESYIEHLVENFSADSVQLATSVEEAESRRALAIQILQGDESTALLEPERFLRDFETLPWWAPVEYSRETWDELVSTGRLSLIRDAALRSSVSRYYNHIEWLALLETDWDEQLEEYEVRAWRVLPPLIRLQVVGALPDASPPVALGPDDVQTVFRTIAQDDMLRVHLGQLANIYGVQVRLYGEVRDEVNAILGLLRGAL